MTDTELILSRLDKLDASIVDLRTELKGDIAELRAELKGDMEGLRSELKGDIAQLKEDMEMLEINLSGQIEMVYKIACENKSNIELLMPYQDKILFANHQLSKVEKLEEEQDVIKEVVQSHSEEIRQLKARLA